MKLNTRDAIRTTLWGLYFRRAATFKRLQKSGCNLKAQSEALTALRTQLNASELWSDEAHRKMVVGLKELIILILPVQFNRAHMKYCLKVLEMIAQCEEVQQPTLF